MRALLYFINLNIKLINLLLIFFIFLNPNVITFLIVINVPNRYLLSLFFLIS